LFGEVFERVRAQYVDPVTDQQLIEHAVKGMLTNLDPHSDFMTAKEFDEMRVQTKGEFGGLGIEVTMEDGVVKVVSPIDDTPAAKAGIKPGDLITHLDRKPVQGMSLSEAVDTMRGKVGTTIELAVRREGKDAPMFIKVKARYYPDSIGPLSS
jgi:carboxyl-terminal processing protease